MKKIFQVIGIISLLCLSFIYTEKTVTVVKEFDEIMIQIKNNYELNKNAPVDAIINGNTIIPGLSGSEIDIDKSYSKMKRYGKYNENLLAYKTVLPNISLNNNMNKYIIRGNKDKNMISLLFLVEANDLVDNIIKILENKNIKATFFLDGLWVEKNNDKLIELINKGYEIGNLGYNYSYSNSSFAWVDNKIKKLSGQSMGYCYHKDINNQFLSLCAMNNNYSIKSSLVVDSNPTISIKENISAGELIVININSEVQEQLPVILDFINSKGFKITTLRTHLQE